MTYDTPMYSFHWKLFSPRLEDEKLDLALRPQDMSRISTVKQMVLDALEGSPSNIIPIGIRTHIHTYIFRFPCIIYFLPLNFSSTYVLTGIVPIHILHTEHYFIHT
jgi:hypothetical protein